jgi:hypothetical protein
MLPEDLREDEPTFGHVFRHRRTHHGLYHTSFNAASHNTRYMQAALDHLRATSYPVQDMATCGRWLSPSRLRDLLAIIIPMIEAANRGSLNAPTRQGAGQN